MFNAQRFAKMAVAGSIGLMASFSSLAATNLLVNGDFEDGSVAGTKSPSASYEASYPVGWTDLFNGNYRYPYTVYQSNVPSNQFDVAPPTAASGTHLLAVGGFYGTAGSSLSNADSWKYMGLYQDLTVASGDTLTVSYATLGPGAVAWLIDTATNTVIASSAAQVASQNYASWTQVSFTATVNTSSIRLLINDGLILGARTRGYIDNVSLTSASAAAAVPEASTLSMMVLGLAGIAALAKRSSARRG